MKTPDLDRLDRADHEPDEESDESQLPERARTKRPTRDEHARHGNAHRQMGNLDVTARTAAIEERGEQQHHAVGRDSQCKDAQEVVQPYRRAHYVFTFPVVTAPVTSCESGVWCSGK